MAKIVFCEDDASIQKLILIAMRSTAHEVLVAENGEKGLALIRQERPAVVFTDMAMPGMTGLELVMALRADPELASIPVVFITASVQRTTVENAVRQGAAGYITKPFSTAGLRARVDEFVAGATQLS